MDAFKEKVKQGVQWTKDNPKYAAVGFVLAVLVLAIILS